MTPGELVEEVAKVLGIPGATVAVHDRYLRTAGLRSKSGRGSGSARVTARDAACLLTAILGSGRVGGSVESVERYSETVPHTRESSKSLFGGIGVQELAALPDRHSFIDALEALLRSAASGSLADWLAQEAKAARSRKADVAPLIEITALTPGTLADIRIAGIKRGVTAAVRYALPDPWMKRGGKRPSAKEIDAWAAKVKRHRGDGDFERLGRISARTILHIAEAMAADQEEGK